MQFEWVDYLVIYDGEDLQSTQLQILDYNFNNQRKTISGTRKYMTIQFTTNAYAVETGFKAYFHLMPIYPQCAEWLNTTDLILASPDYPTIYCNWIITASMASTLSIKFQTVEVKNKSRLFIILIIMVFYACSLSKVLIS